MNAFTFAYHRLTLVCTLITMISICHAQQEDSLQLLGKLENISGRYSDKVTRKSQRIEEGLSKQSEKLMARLQQQQQQVYSALYQKDSNAATAFLRSSQKQYETTLSKLKSRKDKLTRLTGSYVPGLDSMTGVLKYMDKLPTANKLSGKEKLTVAIAASSKAGQSFAGAEEVKKLVRQQQEQLQALAARYKDLNITKQLRQYNKELYYYQQRIQQAKETLNDPTKVEMEVMKLLQKNAGFRSWMQQNGQLAQLFGPVGGGAGGNPSTASAGLQTRQSVQQLVQARLGGSLQQAQQAMAGAVQVAQGQLNTARNRLQQLGTGSLGNSGSNMAMPDFKPNNQKTKPFLQRLEYGVNLQSKGRSRWQPSTTDIGLSLGYKLNDKSLVGIGLAYKLGWGEPIKNIHFSHQGIGLRSYFDYKWKKSWWLSGGYERNYNNSFHSFEVLNNYSAWQHSGLVGLTKKLKQGKRMVETKLLWDFLSYQQIPKAQHVLFRIEYKLK